MGHRGCVDFISGVAAQRTTNGGLQVYDFLRDMYFPRGHGRDNLVSRHGSLSSSLSSPGGSLSDAVLLVPQPLAFALFFSSLIGCSCLKLTAICNQRCGIIDKAGVRREAER